MEKVNKKEKGLITEETGYSMITLKEKEGGRERGKRGRKEGRKEGKRRKGGRERNN